AAVARIPRPGPPARRGRGLRGRHASRPVRRRLPRRSARGGRRLPAGGRPAAMRFGGRHEAGRAGVPAALPVGLPARGGRAIVSLSRASGPAGPPRRLGLAIVWSAGLHAAVVLLAWRAGLLRGAAWEERRETLVEVSLAPTFSPPAPKPVRTPPEEPQRRAPLRHSPAAGSAAARSPAPASPAPSDDASPAAGAGVDAPLDLTGDTLVVASTGNPAGGAGAGAGTGHGRGAAADRSAPSPGAGDRSGGVSLEHHDWACPWPHEADDQQIDE